VTSLGELAALIEGELVGPGALERVLGVSSLEDAGPSEICYYGNPLYRRYLSTTKALAVIVQSPVETSSPNQLVVKQPYEAFRRALEVFAPDRTSAFGGIHPSAVLACGTRTGEGVSIGPCAVVDRDVSIGAGSIIGAGCLIGPSASIGAGCLLHPGVKIGAGCVVGDRVILHSGTVIGSDGFGFVPDPAGHRKVPQNGNVVIEDDVEIGANCAIDRAVTGSTVIGRFSKLDNLIHVAHNVTIGPGCLIAAQVGIAGSTHVGAGVVFGGQAGINGHIRIGDRAVIAAQSGVTKSVEGGVTVSGYPARPHMKALRIDAAISRLPELIDRLGGGGSTRPAKEEEDR
jgi:UDP-3-O-[3-hydroxymyristoyl] glucosamine N-acyltransferase